ncbi:unnamed protein product [Rotaria sp. Silwood2]|nr:unnamed protein product [Rotaria sp. Silwood2]
MGRTTIVVAHRLSTIRNADLILTMKTHSDIVEMGTHSQLILKKGHYFQLAQAQQQDPNSDTHDEEIFCDNQSVQEAGEPEWVYILFGTFASMLAGATAPVVGIIFSSLYHQYANTDLANQVRQTRNLAVIMICLHIAGGIFTWATTWAFAISGERLTRRMRLAAFAAVLRQEVGWFDMEENSVSVLTTQLSVDAAALKVRIYHESI